MKITKIVEPIEPHIQDWLDEQESYPAYLERFFGGTYDDRDGIYDELNNIKLLMKLIGKSVLKEESVAKRQRNKSLKFDEDWEHDAVWDDTKFAFSFREYTYKSLLYLVHTTFENHVIELCEIIERHKKNVSIPFQKKYRGTFGETEERIDKYLSKRFLIVGLKPCISSTKRIMFNRIRNRLYHDAGRIILDKKEHEELYDWIKKRKDVVCLKCEGGKYYKIQIKNFSFILSYIAEVKKFFQSVEYKVSKL